MEQIPYSALKLLPWSDTDSAILKSITKRGYCYKKMTETLLERAIEYKNEFNHHKLPGELKTLYLVPLCYEKEAFYSHNLKAVEFAALYLPYISLLKPESLPKDIKGAIIVAKDNSFSYFTEEKYTLVVDFMGDKPIFVFLNFHNKSRSDSNQLFLAEVA